MGKFYKIKKRKIHGTITGKTLLKSMKNEIKFDYPKKLEIMATEQDCINAKNRLINKVLMRTENQFDSDYSGGSSYFEKNISIYLYDDFSFYHEIKTFTSVSAAGFSMPRESLTKQIGRWSIHPFAYHPQLLLTNSNGETVLCQETFDGGNGIEVLNNQNWKRYLIS